jgi:hypothetical protein
MTRVWLLLSQGDATLPRRMLGVFMLSPGRETPPRSTWWDFGARTHLPLFRLARSEDTAAPIGWVSHQPPHPDSHHRGACTWTLKISPGVPFLQRPANYRCSGRSVTATLGQMRS